MTKSKSYYFALQDILKERGLSQAAARRKYKFDQPGPGFISKQYFSRLCRQDAQPMPKTWSIVVQRMGLTLDQIWRLA